MTWRPSAPILGLGGVQPGFVTGHDGRVTAYMRDNGPAPKRVQRSESRDGGETWSLAEDIALPNPGSSVAPLTLADGRWLLIYNDTEKGRHSLAVSLSSDEGKTWRATRHLDRDDTGKDSFHYPFAIQTCDGRVHVTYSYFTAGGKTIRHASFPISWDGTLALLNRAAFPK